jgi:D-aminopeptidase
LYDNPAAGLLSCKKWQWENFIKEVFMKRARDLGIPCDGDPGPWNAITDVPGVEVGYATLIEGEGALQVGRGPVRTGVTALLPRGKASADPVFAGWFALNGNGELTGTAWVDESGFLEGPVMITNTHSVGVVRDAVVAWQARTGRLFQPWANPVVGETYDGYLNDINGFHVKEAHALLALESAASGPLAEGNVGGGTGMICYEFKGGTGTASRRVEAGDQTYTVGVLVQANHGDREHLRVDGAPVGRLIGKEAVPTPWPAPPPSSSILIAIATDAPLMPIQCRRLAQRGATGLALTGGFGLDGSGDLILAFSTGNHHDPRGGKLASVQVLSPFSMDPLIIGVIEAVEEAILNVLVAAETMTGYKGHTAYAVPHDRLVEVMRRF